MKTKTKASPPPRPRALEAPLNAETVSFTVTNLSIRDAIFLGDVCALFTDPAQARELGRLRAGVAAVIYDQDTGHALVEKILYHPSDN